MANERLMFWSKLKGHCKSFLLLFLASFIGVYDFRHQPDEVVVYDHCVKVIGFGNYFRADRVVGKYLLAVNSWSSRWAKDGRCYF